MIPTIPHQRDSNRAPEPIDHVQSPVDMPGISVQTVESDTSSFTVVDRIVDQQSTEMGLEARDGREGHGVGGVRNSYRSEKENLGVRKFSNARNPGPQQPGPSWQPLSGSDEDLPALQVESSGRNPGPQYRRGSVRNREYTARNKIKPYDFVDLSPNVLTQEGC